MAAPSAVRGGGNVIVTSVHRAATYSGTFDPPTLAHVGIMSHVVRNGGVDKLMVVVNNRTNPKVFRCSAEQRRAMILAALPADIASRVDVVIEPEGGKNALIDRVIAEGRYDWVGVIGEDSYTKLAPEVLAERKWLLVTRDNSVTGVLPPNVTRIAIADASRGISSSRVRELLEKGEDASALVAPAVAAYIKTHALYSVPAMAALATRERTFHYLWTMLAGAAAALPPPPFIPTQSPEEMPNYIKRYLDGSIKS